MATNSNTIRQYTILAILAVLLFVSCVHPLYPTEMFLQHSATLAAILILFFMVQAGSISSNSLLLISLFVSLHIIGARWIYTYVPYNEWIKNILDFDLNAFFGFTRNQYDRLVHFAYGALLLLPAAQILQKKYDFRKQQSLFVAFCLLMAGSMLYEIFEWGLTGILSPDAADSYNGQQGDTWDAQKDMAMALGGETFTVSILLLRHFFWRQGKGKSNK